MNAKKKVCAVIGVGPGNGAALARRFAADGYAVALLARSNTSTAALVDELADARSFGCDVSDANSVARTFAAVRDEMGEVDAVAYNAGSGILARLTSERGRLRGIVASKRARSLPGRQGGRARHEGRAVGRHRRHRRYRVAPWCCTDDRVRSGEGSTAELVRSARATTVAARHPRGADRHRRRRGSAANARANEGQARRILRQADERGRPRVLARPPGQVRMDLRSGGSSLRREMVTAGPGDRVSCGKPALRRTERAACR